MGDTTTLLPLFWIVVGVLLLFIGASIAVGDIDPSFFGVTIPATVAVAWHGVSALICFYLAANATNTTVDDRTETSEN